MCFQQMNLLEGSLQIELFDLSGRLIQSVNQQIQKPSLPAYEGIVLVRIQNENWFKQTKYSSAKTL